MTNHIVHANPTQADKISDKLIAIAVNVTANDRQKLQEETNLSRVTIAKYLRGEIADIETGLGILLFLNAIIEERDRQIEAA